MVVSGATAFKNSSSKDALLVGDSSGLLKFFHSIAEQADAIKTKPKSWRDFIPNNNRTSTEVRKLLSVVIYANLGISPVIKSYLLLIHSIELLMISTLVKINCALKQTPIRVSE